MRIPILYKFWVTENNFVELYEAGFSKGREEILEGGNLVFSSYCPQKPQK